MFTSIINVNMAIPKLGQNIPPHLFNPKTLSSFFMKHGNAPGIGGGGGGACKKKLAFKAGEMGQKIGSEWAAT